MTKLNEADRIYIGSAEADRVYLGADLVWEAPVAGDPWTPALLPLGMFGWWDATVPANRLMAGSNVGTLMDMSAERNNFGRKGSSGPFIDTLNGLNVISFTAASQGLLLPKTLFAGDFYCCAVFYKATSTSNYEMLVDHGFGSGFFIMQDNIGGLWGANALNANTPYGQMDLPAGEAHQISNERRGSTQTTRGDGGAAEFTRTEMPTWATALKEIALGDIVTGSFGLRGMVAEVLLWSRALSAENINRVEGYLAHRWGIQAKLPTSHPYKSSPPLVAPAAPTISGVHIATTERGPAITTAPTGPLLWAVEGEVAGYPFPTLYHQWYVNGEQPGGNDYSRSYSPVGLSAADVVTVEAFVDSAAGAASAISAGVEMALTFHPYDLFASGEVGFWPDGFDPKKGRVRAIAAGITASETTQIVSATNTAVGLVMDASKVTPLGGEMCVNGDFAAGASGWTLGSGWQIFPDHPIGCMAYYGNLAANRLSRASSPRVNNRVYRVRLKGQVYFTANASSTISVNIGGTGQNVVASSRGSIVSGGLLDLELFLKPTSVTAAWANSVSTAANYTTDMRIDLLSVKEVYGYHAMQATAGFRPFLRNYSAGLFTLERDGIDDTLPVTNLPAGTYTRAWVNHLGVVTIEAGVAITTTAEILLAPQVADVLYVNRALTPAEAAGLTAYWEALY
jgi:hypothetical protein